ncbi:MULTISPECIES: glycine oxidase ThiO [unclassified Rhodococcus (in: high G+C Gram-positive bacteria)]|uniref:glycine oxidase ThiO n=1 Tax=unclassified Rhodococcus (in: high G+C Gram-positive bacteria) TaxID=192944 RepID=UPI00146BA369|nr:MULTISPECIES: glycine oxidase ThiO [unclassified Rhodococcus (in: high G+C Gram-positive bacteria)]NMD93996.1 glycine oxidase ThiO [Rhodococcus sp. BL-253-APC-6A1W]NME77754.1 glycine oxidase ThiO [Rhodococcus sp. 105337]
MTTVAVVGGGVIGLSIAWRAARSGYVVTVHDPDPGSGASWVAGGMLAPLSEGWPGEGHVLELGAASLQRWPEFAALLRSGTGIDLVTSTASMTVALDAADAADLRTVAEWVQAQGHEMRVLSRAEVRDLEPSLGPRIRLGLLASAELSVDNRALVVALRRAAVDAGVRFSEAPVADLADLAADRVVLAAGSASSRLWPALPVRPVKGEILRLRMRPGATPLPERTIRGNVHGRPAYLVPRRDGLVVGATQYEAADTQVTVAGVRDLIADAEALLPAIGEYELHEASAGLRPMTPDNLPLIGRLSERVIAATGHGRNGVLLTPLTVDAVLAELSEDPLSEVKHASPQRFTEVVAQ